MIYFSTKQTKEKKNAFTKISWKCFERFAASFAILRLSVKSCFLIYRVELKELTSYQ